MAGGASVTPAEAFAAAAGRAVDAELSAAIDAALAACAAAHPDVGVDASGFAAHLGALGAELPGEPQLLDLHLAFAAASGSAAAIARFERDVLPAVTAALRATGVESDAVDDALQRVREKLLVGGEDGRPRLLEFRAQGALRAWVRVVGVREHLMAQRSRQVERSLGDAVLAAVPDPADDPALAYLRHHYRDALAAALATAIAALEPRDRALLRYSLIDGLRLDEIGAIYGTHKSTISRWLTRARARLWRQICAALEERAGIEASALESLLLAVRSGLDLSFERLLGEAGS